MNLEFLNQYSGVLTIIFSALVSIATVVYAILTWRLVSETRKMREAQTEPKIFVYIQGRLANVIEMVIQNTGSGPAYGISFEINPDFEYEEGKFLSELSLMKEGLSHFAPGQKLKFLLTFLLENLEEKIKNPFRICVIYKNSIGKIYKDVYLIDFSPLIGLGSIRPPLRGISENIERIKNDIHHLATRFHKMEVIIQTKKEFEEEERKKLEELKEEFGKRKENRGQ
jgi:hypothetical protein